MAGAVLQATTSSAASSTRRSTSRTSGRRTTRPTACRRSGRPSSRRVIPNIVVLDLSSFKCGHDAPTYGLIDNIISSSGTPYSALHDIDANKPGGSIKIRVQDLRAHAVAARGAAPGSRGEAIGAAAARRREAARAAAGAAGGDARQAAAQPDSTRERRAWTTRIARILPEDPVLPAFVRRPRTRGARDEPRHQPEIAGYDADRSRAGRRSRTAERRRLRSGRRADRALGGRQPADVHASPARAHDDPVRRVDDGARSARARRRSPASATTCSRSTCPTPRRCASARNSATAASAIPPTSRSATS